MDGECCYPRGIKLGQACFLYVLKPYILKVGRDGFEGEASKRCKRDRSENSN